MLKRLDHLICGVPDIRAAMRWFVVEKGYPEAWPIGRFWPQGLTSGIALGGINLELLQLDEGAPPTPIVRTLVFEPVQLEAAASYYAEINFPMALRDKWEPDPELLRLRGFSPSESKTPRRICRNLVPTRSTVVDFFLCEYVPFLKERLAPEAFPGLPPVRSIEVDIPESPAPEWDPRILPLREDAPVKIHYRQTDVVSARVTAILTDEGDLLRAFL